MPPLTDFIPVGKLHNSIPTSRKLADFRIRVAENGDDGSDDEDVVAGEVAQTYKCPLSLTTFKNPVTS